MRVFVSVGLFLACGAPVAGPPESAPTPAPAVPAAVVEQEPVEPAAAPAGRRCLPVVAAGCGCVYSCGLGTEQAPGRWSVEHVHWGRHPIAARVDRWCVDGQCTEAFFGEIVCGAICPPRPADPTCRLVEDRCESAAAKGEPARPIAGWPFRAWDRAEAITYNHVPYGPGVPLRVYDLEHGWSPKIVERKPITAEQADRAVSWVRATGGEVEVSKCAFPRHAVVLYAGEAPIGTVNVCFECGDILVWPGLVGAGAGEPAYMKPKLAAYKKVFPKWEKFFRDELGFSLTPPLRP